MDQFERTIMDACTAYNDFVMSSAADDDEGSLKPMCVKWTVSSCESLMKSSEKQDAAKKKKSQGVITTTIESLTHLHTRAEKYAWFQDAPSQCCSKEKCSELFAPPERKRRLSSFFFVLIIYIKKMLMMISSLSHIPQYTSTQSITTHIYLSWLFFRWRPRFATEMGLGGEIWTLGGGARWRIFSNSMKLNSETGFRLLSSRYTGVEGDFFVIFTQIA